MENENVTLNQLMDEFKKASAENNGKFDGLSKKFDDLSKKMDTGFEEMAIMTHNGLEEVRVNLESKIESVKTELNGRMDNIEVELNKKPDKAYLDNFFKEKTDYVEHDVDRLKYLHIEELKKLPDQGTISRKLLDNGLKQAPQSANA